MRKNQLLLTGVSRFWAPTQRARRPFGWVRIAAGVIHKARGKKRRQAGHPQATRALPTPRPWPGANTRHQHVSYLITNESAEQIDVRERRPLNDVRPVTSEDKWANVAHAMSFQPQPDSATALRERAHSFRRGAVRALHDHYPEILFSKPIVNTHRPGRIW